MTCQAVGWFEGSSGHLCRLFLFLSGTPKGTCGCKNRVREAEFLLNYRPEAIVTISITPSNANANKPLKQRKEPNLR